MAGGAAPTVVIAGVSPLTMELRRSNDLGQVHTASSVADILDLIRGELKGLRPDAAVFIIADNLVQGNGTFSLDSFLTKICGAGYRPIIVPVAFGDNRVQRQHPQCATVSMPLTANDVLAAIAGQGHTSVQPLADGGKILPIGAGASVAAAKPAETGGWAAPKESSWTVPTETAVEPVPSSMPPAPPFQVEAPPMPVQEPVYATPAPQPGPEPMQPYRPAAAQEADPWTPPTRRTLSDLASHPMTPTQSAPQAWAQPQQNPVDVLSSASWTASPGLAPRRDSDAPVPPAQSRRGYVITIAVSKGGTGKSSLTLNLAAFLGMRLRAQRKTVCVIDANFQQADAGKYLNVYVPNLNDIAHDPSILTDLDPQRLLRTLIHKPEYNMSVLLGPATPDEGNPLAINSDLYNRVLEKLKPHYDYILIDTPVAEKFHTLFTTFALPRADFIIVPVAPNLATLQDADTWLQAAVTAPAHLGGAGIDPARIGIVLNRAEEGIGLSTTDVQAEMGRWRFLGAIPETKEWKKANNANELVAPKNYVELNQAFAQVLYYATGENVLVETFAGVDDGQKSGFFSKLFKGKKS